MADFPPSDGRSLLKGDSFEPANRPSITEVPDWFYKETGWGGCCSKAAFIWWWNVACMFFHLLFASISVGAATQGGKGMDTPRLKLYVTNLTWTPNSTNSLVPVNQAVDGLYLAHMTLWFFLLSASAHGLIVFGNYKQAWAANNKDMRKITRFSGWYYLWIHQCRQPLRYEP